MVLALCCGQNTPARWVTWHRMHHQHSDDPDDPHSPLVAFFWSHVGWLFFEKGGTHSAAFYYKYARDLLDDRFYMYLEKHRAAAMLIYLGHAAAVLPGRPGRGLGRRGRVDRRLAIRIEPLGVGRGAADGLCVAHYLGRQFTEPHLRLSHL